MFATSRLAGQRKWSSLSFVSTLYLHPVLNILLAEVPRQWQAELRLGLQEALVNASKHGNSLDPGKQVMVRYSTFAPRLSWIIADQGSGFDHPCGCTDCFDNGQFHMGEGGRGLYILYQVFDQVDWHQGGREVHLHKTITQIQRVPPGKLGELSSSSRSENSGVGRGLPESTGQLSVNGDTFRPAAVVIRG